jgi:hypothetical protein
MSTKTKHKMKDNKTKQTASKNSQQIHYARWLVWTWPPIILVLLAVSALSTASQGTTTQFSKDEVDAVSLDQRATTATPELTPETEVLAYVGDKGNWKSMLLKELEKGQEFQFDNHLCYIDQNGFIRMNPDVDVTLLQEADRAYDKNNWRFPKHKDIVRFIDENSRHIRHDRMGTLKSGDRFFFQGSLYKTFRDSASQSGLSIQKTGIVLKQVTKTFKRKTSTLIDLTLVDEAGKEYVISGTPGHPFFVPAVNGYVSMGKLKPDSILKTDDGSLATVKSSKTRKGEFTVYNFEVEGTHNYFVSSADGGPMVNVHNACEWDEIIVTEHALQKKHNWPKIFGNKTPTLDDIRPYIDDVLKNGSWKKVDDARGEGKKIIGEIFQAEHNGVWIRGFKDINTGRIIVNNAGAL